MEENQVELNAQRGDAAKDAFQTLIEGDAWTRCVPRAVLAARKGVQRRLIVVVVVILGKNAQAELFWIFLKIKSLVGLITTNYVQRCSIIRSFLFCKMNAPSALPSKPVVPEIISNLSLAGILRVWWTIIRHMPLLSANCFSRLTIW